MIIKDLSKKFNPVPKNQKAAKKQVEIKKKSSKLAKLERTRDKDRVKCWKCDYCHEYSARLDPHEVYGGSNRKRSIEHNFVKNLCRKCHENEKILKKLKIEEQKEFEKTHTREEFIQIFGKSYL